MLRKRSNSNRSDLPLEDLHDRPEHRDPVPAVDHGGIS
jgi:hypothetical protein